MSGNETRDLNAEHLRILRAANRFGVTVNQHGRYVLEGGARPARREREQLMRWGMLEHRRRDWCRYVGLTPVGRRALQAVELKRVG